MLGEVVLGLACESPKTLVLSSRTGEKRGWELKKILFYQNQQQLSHSVPFHCCKKPSPHLIHILQYCSSCAVWHAECCVCISILKLGEQLRAGESAAFLLQLVISVCRGEGEGGFRWSRDPCCSVCLASKALLVSLTDGAVAQDGLLQRQAVALAVQTATCLVPWLERRAGAGHTEIWRDIRGGNESFE